MESPIQPSIPSQSQQHEESDKKGTHPNLLSALSSLYDSITNNHETIESISTEFTYIFHGNEISKSLLAWIQSPDRFISYMSRKCWTAFWDRKCYHRPSSNELFGIEIPVTQWTAQFLFNDNESPMHIRLNILQTCHDLLKRIRKQLDANVSSPFEIPLMTQTVDSVCTILIDSLALLPSTSQLVIHEQWRLITDIMKFFRYNATFQPSLFTKWIQIYNLSTQYLDSHDITYNSLTLRKIIESRHLVFEHLLTSDRYSFDPGVNTIRNGQQVEKMILSPLQWTQSSRFWGKLQSSFRSLVRSDPNWVCQDVSAFILDESEGVRNGLDRVCCKKLVLLDLVIAIVVTKRYPNNIISNLLLTEFASPTHLVNTFATTDTLLIKLLLHHLTLFTLSLSTNSHPLPPFNPIQHLFWNAFWKQVCMSDDSLLLDFFIEQGYEDFLIYFLRLLKLVVHSWNTDWKCFDNQEDYVAFITMIRDLKKLLTRLWKSDMFPYDITVLLKWMDKAISASSLTN